jgi:hypothetical protein
MNYKQENFTSSAYQRCHTVTITNPHAQANTGPGGAVPSPMAFFQEEQVVDLPDGKVILTHVGTCSKAFNPTEEFNIIDPRTGELTGTKMSHGALYAVLYSLYIQTAKERDETVIAAVAADAAQKVEYQRQEAEQAAAVEQQEVSRAMAMQEAAALETELQNKHIADAKERDKREAEALAKTLAE